VVHYDLSWNPTRHQQRDGRVDRYGQPKEVVDRCCFTARTPDRRAILQVILRKAKAIQKDTGVQSSSGQRPQDDRALLKALLLVGKRNERAEASRWISIF